MGAWNAPFLYRTHDATFEIEKAVKIVVDAVTRLRATSIVRK
jgi:hypothetical protein